MLGTFAVVSFIGVSILGGGGGAAGSTFRDTTERVFFSHHIADPSIIKAPRTDYPSGASVTLFALVSYNASATSANPKIIQYAEQRLMLLKEPRTSPIARLVDHPASHNGDFHARVFDSLRRDSE